ncbi:MAG: hypothetical protein QOE61_2541 [Micromonosporaceae bacterium]|jgi:hypothetical protein|nr:hypothetical protein [Micromonosporaceae bacterium]
MVANGTGRPGRGRGVDLLLGKFLNSNKVLKGYRLVNIPAHPAEGCCGRTGQRVTDVAGHGFRAKTVDVTVIGDVVSEPVEYFRALLSSD